MTSRPVFNVSCRVQETSTSKKEEKLKVLDLQSPDLNKIGPIQTKWAAYPLKALLQEKFV